MHSYMPYDLPGSVRRFLARVRPQLAVILETELWPNLFAHCHARAVPLAIVNARLSPRSLRGYLRLRTLSAATLQQARLIAAQSERDAERFRRLGARPTQLSVCGNIKFDMEESEGLADQARGLRSSWNYGSLERRQIWVAASTHAGEDETILAAFERVRETVPDLLLVLVPRHPERFDQVAELTRDWCRRRGWHSLRHSQGDACDAATAIVVGDTLGELRLFYAAADIAFVGGSLVPVGGHNILEPAQAGLPVICGPHMFNFTEAVELLVADEALVQVHDVRELADAVGLLCSDARRRQATGRRGQQVVAANRGALQRTLAVLDGLLAPEV
jgi:3-deoxy-D-manno-octulosonic-acid transferase